VAGTLGGGDEDDIIVGINVTPLVDVTLVLLIIFMVTATYIVKETIEIELPEAANAGESVETTLAIVIDGGGKVYLNGEEMDEVALSAAVSTQSIESKARDEKLQAIISADKGISHGRVVHIIDLVKGLGVNSFAINIVHDDQAALPRSPAALADPTAPAPSTQAP